MPITTPLTFVMIPSSSSRLQGVPAMPRPFATRSLSHLEAKRRDVSFGHHGLCGPRVGVSE